MLHTDLFGTALTSGAKYEILECVDGYIHANDYDVYRIGTPLTVDEQDAFEYVFSDVVLSCMDFGCGIGKHIHYLSNNYNGHFEGIDLSPQCVEHRGDRNISLGDIHKPLYRSYDVGLLMNNGIALMETIDNAVYWFHRVPCNTLIVQGQGLPGYTEYAIENINEGKFPGEMIFRWRWGHFYSPWYSRLLISLPYLTEYVLKPTKWKVAWSETDNSFKYTAVLRKLV
jgi:hypothetical protein